MRAIKTGNKWQLLKIPEMVEIKKVTLGDLFYRSALRN